MTIEQAQCALKSEDNAATAALWAALGRARLHLEHAQREFAQAAAGHVRNIQCYEQSVRELEQALYPNGKPEPAHMTVGLAR